MKYLIQIILVLLFGAEVNLVSGQASWIGHNNTAPPGSYLGWDNSVTFPLRIANDANQPILFRTNSIERMRIESFGNVGIGTFNNGPKLQTILTNANASTTTFRSIAIEGHNRFMWSDSQEFNQIGVRGVSDGNNSNQILRNTAGDFLARNAFQNIGLETYVGADPMNSTTVGRLGWGVRSIATDHTNGNVAVDGRAAPHPSALGAFVAGIVGGVDGGGTNMWAGWFEGPTFTPLNNWTASDEMFKTNVEEISGALDVISQLNPMSYNFLSEEYSFMNFPDGVQYGVLAQELVEVLPSLVREATRPEQRDTLGNLIRDELTFKTVNYTSLVPILIAGMKEQQTIINAQNELLAQVLERLDAVEQCCNYDGSRSTPGNSGALTEKMLNENSIEGGNELFQNIPNPFRESTTISYSLEEGGRVQLSIYDKTGKVVTTLIDANQGPGRYSEVWNAIGMPSGVYHYALFVNGELLVKRAIKLQE